MGLERQVSITKRELLEQQDGRDFFDEGPALGSKILIERDFLAGFEENIVDDPAEDQQRKKKQELIIE